LFRAATGQQCLPNLAAVRLVRMEVCSVRQRARTSPVIVWIPRRAGFRLLNFPVRRGEEADAVRHASEPKKAGSFGEPHQLLGQIERAADLTPARAFAGVAFLGRAAFARRGRKQRRLSRAARRVE
jgi:hypothetical protein